MPSHSLMELGDGYVTMERLRNRRDGAPSGRTIKHGRHARVDEVPITGECPAGLQYPPDSDSHDRQSTTDCQMAAGFLRKFAGEELAVVSTAVQSPD